MSVNFQTIIKAVEAVKNVADQAKEIDQRLTNKAFQSVRNIPLEFNQAKTRLSQESDRFSKQASEMGTGKALIKNLEEDQKPGGMLGRENLTHTAFGLTSAPVSMGGETTQLAKAMSKQRAGELLDQPKVGGVDLATEARKYGSAEKFIKANETSLKTAETGKPITTKLYHGSPDARFAEEFDPNKTGYYPDAPELKPDMKDWESLNGKPSQGFRGESTTGNKGVSFTDDYQTAKSYSQKPAFDNQNSVPMVLERYVQLDNPKVYDLGGKKWNLNMEVEMRKALSEGHDGLVFKNILDDYHPSSRNVPTNNIIVLDPSKIKTKSQLTDIYNQAQPKVGGVDLATEARKYGSAEEFVKSFDTYHGTPNTIEGGKLTFGGGKQLKKGGYMGGHFLTNEPDIAKEFSFGGEVYRASGDIKNRVFDVNANKKMFKDYVGKAFKNSDGEMEVFTKSHYDFMFPGGGKADWSTVYTDLANQFAKEQGKIGITIPEYAGGKLGKTYQLFEDNIPIYTDKQLTDIYNQAQPKVGGVEGAVKAVDAIRRY